LGELLPGHGDGLTGEPAANEVDALDPFKIEGADVSMSSHIWPVLGEDSSAKLIDFDLPSTGPPGALEAKIKSPNP
jgi:hypothetical protein